MELITNDELTKIVEDTVENEKELIKTVFDIVVKIKNLPNGTKTTIAKLINYNPEISLVSPLTQGKINYYVKEVCKKINIKLEQHNKSFSGIAYFYEFTKN